MATIGPEERRAQRQVNSARLRPIRTRSRSQSPEKSGDRVGDGEKDGGVSLPKVKVGKTVTIKPQQNNLEVSPAQEKARRGMSRKHNKVVMDKERRQAAAYRRSVGRRNAVDVGTRGGAGRRNAFDAGSKPGRCKSSGLENGKGKQGNKDGEGRSKSSCEGTVRDEETEVQGRIKKLAAKVGLTSGQIKAFREVFDLFDSNGGGSIDAEELDEALRSVDIELTREEIKDVLKTIDNDGNGEIDFPEFLQLMTNTERFIQALTKDQEEGSGRETLLFDALTEFMKKSALHSMDEIVGYYSHKYKRTQIPHVVTHYAAGARLIGLSEKQLKEHMENLKANGIATVHKGINSPYNEPLHILSSYPNLHRKQLKQPKRIRLFVSLKESQGGVIPNCDTSQKNRANQYHVQHEVHADLKVFGRLHHIPVSRRGFGWVSEHTDHMEVKLPPAPLRKLTPFSELTTEDLPAIRNSVCNATRLYTNQRLNSKLRENLKHWKALQVNLISPKILQSHFKSIYSVYSLVGQKHLKIPAI